MKQNPDITIFVLNWNGAEDTIECLTSLQNLEYDNYSVVVIDNNSDDNSNKRIKEKFPKQAIVELPQNYGYAGGNNSGFKNVIDKETKYVLFLNNDTTVDKKFLNKLVDGINKFGSDVILSPKIYYQNDPGRIWFAGATINFYTGNISHLGIREKDNKIYLDDQKADYVSGCCMLLTSKLFRELNGFDESFGMYSEDVDLCLRAEKLNIQCYMIANSHIYHKVSASLGGNLSLSKNTKKLKSLFKLIYKHKGIPAVFSAAIFLLIIVPIKLSRILFRSNNTERYAKNN
ncbi:MAG: glycosyltransferase family 2 protein [Candidatus Marinimicrobia bacterium]|jgi:hypothetical protein|nr:glycosyltransferase family 2 protein [Candidatus Neomarinimicrobiota bacterium]MBT3634178.1 glycosyltransferase family 2 protein [Candidatus Neomarinimicrobiota bacterium]MBT3683215.1 glycosyltransferase family 2 protein [Candidatus Neomarinimicrobiota bacterium]MBT3759737.1 glycosyltransferase family 2 protein [Candidatus Neomarinimicrobiota bacterium]MBT3895857.1 glycosyltransferase family 2 protein [Candidatus Neomarinimicrobiota bacterium]